MKKIYTLLAILILNTGLFAQNTPSIHEEQLNYYNSLGPMTDAQYDKLSGYELMPSKAGNRSNCTLDKIVFYHSFSSCNYSAWIQSRYSWNA